MPLGFLPLFPASARRLATLGVQAAFAVTLVAGTYAFSQYGGTSEAPAAVVKSADRLLEPVPGENEDFTLATRGDRMPVVVRTSATPAGLPIDDAVAHPAATANAKSSPNNGIARRVPAFGGKESAAAMPAGVERFDNCHTVCETRDPMIVAPAAPRGASISVPSQPVAEAAPSESGLFSGLPALPSAQQLIGQTLDGTEAAIDRVKEAVGGALDFVR